MTRQVGLSKGSGLSILAIVVAVGLTVSTRLEPVSVVAAANPITDHPFTATNASLNYITTGPDGNLWFTDQNLIAVGRVTPTGTFTEKLLSCQGTPEEITTGPDGSGGTALWFTNQGCGIGKIDPTTFTVTEIPITNAGNLQGIVAGPDGAIWFTDYLNGLIERLDPANDTVQTYPTSGMFGPFDIAVGPDGSGGTGLWFTDDHAQAVTLIQPALTSPGTAAGFTQYPIPLADPSMTPNPEGITQGPGGAMWFTEFTSAMIGEIVPSTGAFKQHPLPDGAGFSSWPTDLVTGSDGNLWWTEQAGASIGRMTPNGYISEFSVPTGPNQSVQPVGISRGPASGTRSVWFAYSGYDSGVGAHISGVGRVSLHEADTTAIAMAPKSLNVVQGTEGRSISGVMGTFIDDDGNQNPANYTATINWGDGVSSPGAVAFVNGHFTVTGSHRYLEETLPTSGPGSSGSWYQTVVSVSDSDGTAGAAREPFDIADATLSASGRNVSLDSSETFSGIVSTFKDNGGPEAAGNYTATIDWGDGTTSSGTVASLGGSKFSVSASHSYASSKSRFTATVSIADEGGSTTSSSSAVADPT